MIKPGDKVILNTHGGTNSKYDIEMEFVAWGIDSHCDSDFTGSIFAFSTAILEGSDGRIAMVPINQIRTVGRPGEGVRVPGGHQTTIPEQKRSVYDRDRYDD